MRRPVSVERLVAITWWILAISSEYCSIVHWFRLAHCTVCVIVHEACKAVDYNGLFRDLWPGSVHNACVSHCKIRSAMVNYCRLRSYGLHVELRIPVFLIGDLAYPLLSWLIQLFYILHCCHVTINYNYNS